VHVDDGEVVLHRRSIAEAGVAIHQRFSLEPAARELFRVKFF
jgi:hypothetical protein